MVKIAGAQFAGSTDRGKNLDRIVRAVTEAADRGARVVCLPELSTSIYFCYEANHRHFDYAESIPGPSTEEVSALAKRLGVSVVLPLFERVAEGQFYNSAVVISSEGELLGARRRGHDEIGHGRAVDRSETEERGRRADRHRATQ